MHDSRMLEAVVDAVPPIRSRWGPPRKRPSKLHADKAYDHRRCRQALTCSEPPGEVTHWTGRGMARAVGISLRAVQRI